MKDQTEIPEALRLADICAKKGLFAVEDELRRLHAESELHLQELRSYRITVENREASIAELEAKLAAQQPVEVTDNMALAFHRALTDGALGADDLNDIKTGLRAALSHVQPLQKTVAAQQGVQPVLGWVHKLANGKISSHFYKYEPHCDNAVRDNGGEKIAVVAATHPITQGLDAQVRVGTLWIEESGANDIELSPFSLPKLSPGEYALFTLAAQAKQAEALQASRSGGCGCCSNACADRLDGCRFVHESPGAADMAAAQAKQGGAA